MSYQPQVFDWRRAALPTGKSECSRCGGATGRFCRACLLVRYGQRLEGVRQQMAAGEWLCPHCYEDDHPDEVLSNKSKESRTPFSSHIKYSQKVRAP